MSCIQPLITCAVDVGTALQDMLMLPIFIFKYNMMCIYVCIQIHTYIHVCIHTYTFSLM
jgi:hypothetical protein